MDRKRRVAGSEQPDEQTVQRDETPSVKQPYFSSLSKVKFEGLLLIAHSLLSTVMTYRQLLQRNADFRRLWIGQVVSEIGDWLNNIAVLALTIELAGPGRQGVAIALYAIARHLPLFLFGPIAGVVVDRIDRRRVMIVADVARAFLALGFIVAHQLSALPVIYIVGASLFATSAFFNAAKRAAIPNIVNDANELLSANSLSASTTAATIAVGSACGGIVATFFGRGIVFALNAGTFLISAEMIRRLRGETQRHDHAGRPRRGETTRPKRGERKSLTTSRPPRVTSILYDAVEDFREGLRYVRSDQVLTALFIVAAGWGLGNGAARALYSIFGARLGEQTAAVWVARPRDFGISVLFVAMGLGGVMGAPVARRFNAAAGEGLGRRMGRSMMLDGCGLAIFSAMPNLWGAAAVLVAREMNFAVWWTAQQTIIMRRTDNRYGGRVFASYETLTTLMMVSSMFASGAAADTYGIRVVAGAGGTIIALSGLLWFLLQRHRRSASEQIATSSENISEATSDR